MSGRAFLDGRIVLHSGDSRDVLKTMGTSSIDSVVTDPPYALVSIAKRFGKPGAKNNSKDAYQRASAGFMGKQWDTGETAFATEFWAEIYRVLKPGGHVIAASSTRTYHRLASAIEDAGFEIRDQILWLYGSGFPKSLDVSKAIDKAKGCERGKVRVEDPRNPRATGGGLDGMVGATRPWIEAALERGYHEAVSDEAVSWQGWGTALKPACEPWVLARKPLIGTVAANVLEHGTGALNIDGCRVVDGSETGGEKPLYTPNGKNAVYGAGAGGGAWANTAGRHPANVIHDGSPEVLAGFPESAGQGGLVRGTEPSDCHNGIHSGPRTRGGIDYKPRGDSGSASRFFYSAKADAFDRIGSKHPTVKPVDLMQWLCRLITPPGGLVLDPFAGTGTTGEAAFREGFRAILIEREEEYRNDIARRMSLALAGPEERSRESLKARGAVDYSVGPLFGEVLP